MFPFYYQCRRLRILRNAYRDIYTHFFWNSALQWLFEYWLCILLHLQTRLSPFTFCIPPSQGALLKSIQASADESTPWPNDPLLFAIVPDFLFSSIFRLLSLCASSICLPGLPDFSTLSKASFSSPHLIAFGNAFKSRADLGREGPGWVLDKSFCFWFIKIFRIF